VIGRPGRHSPIRGGARQCYGREGKSRRGGSDISDTGEPGPPAPTSLVAVSTIPLTEPTEIQAGFDIPVELQILDRTNRVVAARIRRVSQSFFELSCSESLPERQRLALSHEGRRIVVEVSSAAPQANGDCLLTVKVVIDQPGDVRSELRLPTDLPAALRVAGETEQIDVRIVDMSPSGMGIEMTEALPPGAKVCVNLAQGLAFGDIRFCRQTGQGIYLAGFSLKEYIGQESS
jgi:hypothetical protein